MTFCTASELSITLCEFQRYADIISQGWWKYSNYNSKILYSIFMKFYMNILKCSICQKTTGSDAKTLYNDLEAIDMNLKESNNDSMETDSNLLVIDSDLKEHDNDILDSDINLMESDIKILLAYNAMMSFDSKIMRCNGRIMPKYTGLERVDST